MNKVLIIVLLIFFSTSTLFTQKFTFLSYSTKQGLAQSQVYDIKQDKNNYLWVATLQGLSRFNGKTFKNFFEIDGLLSNKINSLFIDEEDNVWVITSEGISIVSNDSIRSFQHNNLFEGEEVLEVIHYQNKIWISTYENGIFCFKKSEDITNPVLLKEYHKDFIGLEITDIEIVNSSIYVTTNSGVFSISNKTVTKQSFLENTSISGIHQNSLGDIWISTSEKGVYQIKEGTVIPINQENSQLTNNFLTNIFIDKNDKVWLCSNTGLTEVSENRVIQTYQENNGFAYKPVVVFEDIEGNIWIGTDGSGIIKFANKEFLYITGNKELHSERIMAVCEDAEGFIWLGSNKEGIAKFKKNETFSYNARETTIPSNNIWTFLKDAENTFWIGTSDGLSYYDHGVFKTFTIQDGLPANKVQSLFQESEGVLWIGTTEGVAFYKDKKFIVLDSFPYTDVRSISSTEDGVYWFGTYEGLVRYDGFVAELILDSAVMDNKIYTVVASGNELWLGTERGLIYYNGFSFDSYKFSSENYQTDINFLHLDEQNFLWIGTNSGVYTVDIKAHDKGRKEIYSYTTNNGLIGMETNLNSIFEDSKGNIWFGTSEGINLYQRDKTIKNQEFIPSVHLTNVKLFFDDKNYLNQLKSGKISQFSSKQNTVTFSYHSNFFKDPDAIKYSYKLVGLEEEWSPMESTNFARYPNLAHGSYVFMVRASIDGKNWSNIDEVKFTIKAPFWLTPWFLITSILVLFGIVYYFIDRRRKTIRKEREVELLNYKNKLIKLEQQSLNASMNRHFIFNSLNSIQFYINKEDKLSANRYLSNFSKLIRKNLDSSSAEDNLIPLSEEIERLSLYLSLENMRFKEKFSYEINIEPEVDAEMTKVPAMFMQPFIENSIWHGVLPMEIPGKITIHIYKNNNKTFFEIFDNGIGIDTSIKNKSKEQNEHSSKGMKIATNRIELLQKVIQKEISIQGPFQINQEGKVLGTKVVIIFG